MEKRGENGERRKYNVEQEMKSRRAEKRESI